MDKYIPREFTLSELLNMRMTKTEPHIKDGISVWNMNNTEYEVHQYVNGKIEGKAYRFTNTRLIWVCDYKNGFQDGVFERFIPFKSIIEYVKGLNSGYYYADSDPHMKPKTTIRYFL